MSYNQRRSFAHNARWSAFLGLLLVISLLLPITGASAEPSHHDPTARIGNFVWFDANENGIQDSGEAGIPGVDVKIFDINNNLLTTTTTDSSGLYGFDVATGSYTVQFILPAGYHFTQQHQGADPGLDSDADPSDGKTTQFDITAGETNNDFDAGLIRNPDVCFAVADGTTSADDSSAEDTLAYLDRTTGATAPVAGTVGNTGAYNIEAVAFQPGGQTLFAADAGQLGTLNLVTGQFTARPNVFGSGDGYISGIITTISFDDVDSLSFDPTTGDFYGATRRSGLDLLFRIDPATGAFVPGAFPDPTNPSLTVDFVEVGAIAGLDDVDDIAIDPVTGVMYGSINSGSASADKLVIIDNSTGAVTEVGTIYDASNTPIQDMEGLSFFNDGMLYGTTGKNGPTTNGLYQIDKATAIATEIGNFTDPLRDFEGSDCLSGNAFVVIEKSTNGEDADTLPGPNVPLGDPVTWTYFVRNTGNMTLVNVQVSDDQLPAQNPICTIATLGPGQSNTDAGVSCTASGIATAGQYTNTATVAAETLDSSDVISDTDLSHYLGVDYNTASIGDFVWHDMFHSQTHEVDGIQDSGEPGLAGVVVELYDNVSNLVDTKTTSASGYYQFTLLLPGTYTVKIADSNFVSGGVLEGWYASPPDEGSDDSKDSDGDRTNHAASVSLSLGETNGDVDFGFFRTSVDLQKIGPQSNQLGDTITYYFRVENTGDVVLHGGVSVYDAMLEPSGDHKIWDHVVWPGEVYTFDRTYTPTEFQCGALDNTATAIGHPLYPDGSALPNVTAEDSWTVTVDCAQPDLGLDKSFRSPINRTTLIVGETASFDIVTTNTGGTVITYLPLNDAFDNACFTYTTKSSQPEESGYSNPGGTISWLDLTLANAQDLAVGAAFTTTVHFEVTGVSAQGYNEASVTGALDEYGNAVPDRISAVDFSCVDARISIDPGSAVNAAGDPHIFTITVEKNEGNGWGPAAGVHPVVTVSPTPDSVTDTCDTTGTDANGECTVTINSNSSGQFTAHAAADIDFGGGAIAHRQTDGSNGNSDDAAKTYVNARLSLTPAQAANQVGDQHTFTAHLEFDTGSGWADAPAGETINFSKDSGPGTLGASSCSTAANGECTVTLDSSTTGATQVTASWSGSISTSQGSASATADDSATKHWTDARLSLTPAQAANQVGDQHTFTAHLEFDTGSGWADAPAGETINFSKDSGPGTLGASSCSTAANGECTVTLDSSTTGATQVTASWSGSISTSHGSASATADDSATKHWTDARLSLTPAQATNQVDDQHTFTAHLEFDTGSGWADAPAGETINFSKDSGPGTLGASSCSTASNGECTVTLDSSTTGATQVTASWSGSISTSHGSASATADDSATKHWVDASISISPTEATNSIGDSHTFTVTVMADDGTGMSPVAGVNPTVVVSPTSDSLTDNCATIGSDSNGQCTVIINNNSNATFTANASITLTVGGLSLTRDTAGNSGPGGSGPAIKHYVTAAVGDFVWNDLDADGIQETGEPPVVGLTVWLYDSGNTLQFTTTTNANGIYAFTALPLGDYFVQFDLPTGAKFSPQDQGSNDAVDSDPDPTTGKTAVFSLSTTPDLTRDAGQYCLNSISGIVFFDANQDQTQGLGESGIPGVVLDLYLDNGDNTFDPNTDTVLTNTTTAGDGAYSFLSLEPDTYFVVERQPDGYDSTTVNSRMVSIVGSCAGASSTDNNFGEVYGSIGDFIFLDSNGNGTQEPSEQQGVVNVLVTVTNLGTGDVYTTTSDANGVYTVGGLPTGTYQIDVPASLPGLQRTTSAPKDYTLGVGENYVEADFGYIAPTAVQFVDLSVQATAKGVMVSWRTASEGGETVFQIWRAQSADGAYKVIGSVDATNDPSGASYTWLDRTISPDVTTWYKIESVASGEFFGPVPSKQEPQPGGSMLLFIPFVSR